MSRPASSRSNYPASSASSIRSGSTASNGRYLRPVPYATTLALEQFFDGGSMEQHLARRTTPAAKPSPLSPHHQSRRHGRHSRQSSVSTRDTQQSQHQQQPSPLSGRRGSKHHEPTSNSHHRNRPTPAQLAPVLPAERDIGKGASLPVVDETGQVWYDWEEKQEFAPLITVEDERSGWVNFPGATGRNSDGEGSDDDSSSPLKPAFPLRAVLDAFTFQQGPPAGTGPGAGDAAAPTITTETKDPLHGLGVPPGERPRGKDRRIVRRADSLPAIVVHQAEKEAAAREFLDASFDPVKAMLAMQQGTADTPPAHKLGFGKRASMSMKGLKKMFFRKKSTSS